VESCFSHPPKRDTQVTTICREPQEQRTNPSQRKAWSPERQAHEQGMLGKTRGC